MAIRATRVWVGGETWEAAHLVNNINGPIMDRLGRNGVVELESSLAVQDGTGGDRYVQVPSGTTAQRPSNPEVGMMRFNTTTSKLEIYVGQWRNVG